MLIRIERRKPSSPQKNYVLIIEIGSFGTQSRRNVKTKRKWKKKKKRKDKTRNKNLIINNKCLARVRSVHMEQ